MPGDPLIVYQPPWDWDFLWNRSQPLARALAARGATVVYINSRLDPGRAAGLIDRIPKVRGFYYRAFRRAVRANVVQSNVPGVNLLSWTHSRPWPQRWDTARGDHPPHVYPALTREVLAHIEGHKEKWLLTSRPMVARLEQLFPWDRVVADLEDPWIESYDLNATQRAVIEHTLGTADRVFANGPLTAAAYARYVPTTIINLPNGIDDSFLDRLQEPIGPRPGYLELTAGGSYRAVYTGNINNRFDYPFLRQVLERSPGYEFFFVGPVNLPDSLWPVWREFLAHPRVHHHPPVPHSEVPTILRHADALLLPYTAMGGKLMFPAKLFEYAAVGKPVLACGDYTGNTLTIPLVRIARTVDEWVDGLSAATAAPDPAAVEAGWKLAAANTWLRRADEFLCAVRSAPPRRSGGVVRSPGEGIPGA